MYLMSEQNQPSWQRGFNDGKAGHWFAALPDLQAAGVDERSYMQGWAEGEAERRVSAWIENGTAGSYLASQFRPRSSDPH